MEHPGRSNVRPDRESPGPWPRAAAARAISAPRSQRTSAIRRASFAPPRHGRDPQQLFDRRAARRTVRPAMPDAWLVLVQSTHPGRVFDPMIVGAEQVSDLGRVARAAQILSNKGIEQGRAFGRRQPQLLGEPHADHGAAHPMSLRMPLRDVERDRQGRDDLGKPNLGRRRSAGSKSADRSPRLSGRKRLRWTCGSRGLWARARRPLTGRPKRIARL